MTTASMPASDVLSAISGTIDDSSGYELEMILTHLDDATLKEVAHLSALIILETNISILEEKGIVDDEAPALTVFPNQFPTYEPSDQLNHLRMAVWLTAIYHGPVPVIDLIWKSMTRTECVNFVRLIAVTACLFDREFDGDLL